MPPPRIRALACSPTHNHARLPTSYLPFLYPLPYTHLRSASHASQGRANKAPPGPGKRLGLKRGANELVVPGTIIFRQRGTLWFPGENVGMGRDHTIYAKEKGYVTFYKDVWRGKGYGGAGRLGGINGPAYRRYIGIVFERGEQLPRPPGRERKRRLGFVGRERRDLSKSVEAGKEREREGVLPATDQEGGSANKVAAVTSGKVVQQGKDAKVMAPLRPELKMSSGYQFRESNRSIGRVAERAGVKVRSYKRGDRFLAWRKLNARKARNAERRTLSSRKAKGGKKK